jgi:hypothetical protein
VSKRDKLLAGTASLSLRQQWTPWEPFCLKRIVEAIEIVQEAEQEEAEQEEAEQEEAEQEPAQVPETEQANNNDRDITSDHD